MKKYVYWVVALYFLFWVIALFPHFCAEPNLAIWVTNDTSETVYVEVIYTKNFPDEIETVGDVLPGATVYKDLEMGIVLATLIKVEAVSRAGITVFSREYTRNEFLDADMRITITPS